jgi:hypothetical protein
MAIQPASIPIGGCGQKGQPACPPIYTIVGADGKTYTIVGAVQVVAAPNPEKPVKSEGVESNNAPEA